MDSFQGLNKASDTCRLGFSFGGLKIIPMVGVPEVSKTVQDHYNPARREIRGGITQSRDSYRQEPTSQGASVRSEAFLQQKRIQGWVPPIIFGPQTEARRAGKKFWETTPPHLYLRVWMTVPLPPILRSGSGTASGLKFAIKEADFAYRVGVTKVLISMSHNMKFSFFTDVTDI